MYAELNDFSFALSMTSCDIWGDANRCDGTLCDADHECQSGCCGAFASFTHARCLPSLGNYCAGRDVTRRQAKRKKLPAAAEPDEDDASIDKELQALKAKERLLKDPQLLSLEGLMEPAANEIPDNGGKKKKDKKEKREKTPLLAPEEPALGPCKQQGHKDLCDDEICVHDGNCRSGCCSQVLTKGYNRCVAMLVGDYCPRALDPILEMLEAEADKDVDLQALGIIEEVARQEDQASAQGRLVPAEPAELPCNVFGTVDRCDGMACEHDGNCFSGCCSLFVSGDQKRCMPLVGGDLCPIAIDVVEKFQIIDE